MKVMKRIHLDTEKRWYEDTGIRHCWQAKERSGTDPSHGPQKETTMLTIWNFQPSELGNNEFLLSKPPSLWYTAKAAPHKVIH